ncbi:hypothetical protein [Ruminococcus sp. Marseille-P328]|jgi:hypothetical protein|uniref:hypothetical protein n=1 Tax=Ruminococcus sp. Marseille-P328 TaxID=1816688 RepID=UPI003561CF49
MADQAINALSTKTAPETSDQLLLVGAGEPQLIDYDKLADAILNKITSKKYALDAGTMTLPAALNALNGNLGSHNTFYKNLGDDNNPLSSYDLTLKGGAKSDNEISYLIFIGDRGYSTFIKTPSLYIASGGVTYASVQRLILGSNSSIEASITKGNPFTVSFTGFAPKSSLLICIPLVRA